MLFMVPIWSGSMVKVLKTWLSSRSLISRFSCMAVTYFSMIRFLIYKRYFEAYFLLDLVDLFIELFEEVVFFFFQEVVLLQLDLIFVLLLAQLYFALLSLLVDFIFLLFDLTLEVVPCHVPWSGPAAFGSPHLSSLEGRWVLCSLSRSATAWSCICPPLPLVIITFLELGNLIFQFLNRIYVIGGYVHIIGFNVLIFLEVVLR